MTRYMTEPCGKMVYWWDGEYEGECELPADHEGFHYDGLSWYNDDNEEVPAPEEKKEYVSDTEAVSSSEGENSEKVVIRLSIEYPASDGTHEISQGTATIMVSDIDRAYPDLVLYKMDNLVNGVLGRFHDHKWQSKFDRCGWRTTEWAIAAPYSCKLQKGHDGKHILDR